MIKAQPTEQERRAISLMIQVEGGCPHLHQSAVGCRIKSLQKLDYDICPGCVYHPYGRAIPYMLMCEREMLEEYRRRVGDV